MTSTTETRDAYALLSKPTLELNDQDIKDICAELRKRRERFLAGQKDNPPKQPKAKVEMTPEAKQQAAAEVLNAIENLF